ncbi:hypothetical protein [Nocardioides ungokensis]|uniref:hypothetical protein n=1 Tax=Nocardioides ungokensis TaxID=1643322 RepID=UPI0015DE3913|nr:hypothetical protein [Nocardioides ungokensis]
MLAREPTFSWRRASAPSPRPMSRVPSIVFPARSRVPEERTRPSRTVTTRTCLVCPSVTR